jgi:hypothetical protein
MAAPPGKAPLRSILLPLAYFTGLAVVMTWPLILNMGHSVALQFGDNLEYVWLIGWFEKALLHLHTSPSFVPMVNYPEGWNPAHSEFPRTMIVPVLPLSAWLGPVAAYNVSILLSYILSGLFVFAWTKRLTGSMAAGLLSGSIFAFSPYRYSHFLVGHLGALGTHWLPLYFMSLLAVLLEAGRRPGFPILAGIGLGLIAFTSPYYLYMTLLLTAVIIAVRFLLVSHWQPVDSEVRHRLAVFAVTGLPLALLGVAPFLQLSAEGNLAARAVESVRKWSASPTDFFIPATTSQVWGQWIGRMFERDFWIEATLYLGVIALVAAGIGVVRNIARPVSRGSILLILAMTLTAALLALGTDLHWLSRPVLVEVPQFLRALHPHSPAHVPLPGRLLFEWLPFYDRMRVWMRYGVFVGLGVSVLAGYGLAWISERLQGGRRTAVVLGLLGLALLDFLPRPQPYARVEPRSVDEWLAAQTDSGALVEFPFESDQAQLYYSLIHNKPILGGPFNAFPPPQFQRIKPILDSFPDRASIDTLQDLGVRYVLVHAWRYADFDRVDRLARELGLVLVGDFDGVHVYTLGEDSLAP